MNFYYILISNWIVLLLIYSSSRFAFVLSNLTNLPNFSVWDFIEGIRFDLSVLAYINASYFFLISISSNSQKRRFFHFVKKSLFVVTNGTFIIWNNIDIVYFKFNLRRSSKEIFNLIENSKDIVELIPQFLLYYWPVTLLTAIQIWILVRANQNTSINPAKNLITYSIRIITIILTSILFARGGLQLKPIKPINAGEVFETPNNSIILNSPFYLIHTFQKNELKEIDTFSEDEISLIYQTTKHYKEKSLKHLNIVIIIIESLSKEFVGYYNNGVGFTPFLDELIKNSLVFENAFSNGLRSIDAVPAIISSIPNLMNDAFINSKYANNSVPSLSSILNKEGYKTSFFHGGKRGTMGFLGYCNKVKFNNYFGMEDFPENKFFDGDWGIYDEPFLNFSAEELKKGNKPFFATIFTLSSHPPYNLPPKYSNYFPKGNSDIHELIGYTDHSLKLFFDKIKHQDWFKETLFVITADHTSSEVFDSEYEGYLNRHKIPLLFHLGDNTLKGRNTKITQQIDIMPTILEIIGYNKPFFSFGKSVLQKESWAIIGSDHKKFLLTEKGILHKNINEIVNYKDSHLSERTNIDSNDSKKIKAIEQVYNNLMISNKLEIERKTN